MKRWVAMILEEPYRVFFGLGVLVGMVGVLMWPAFHAGWMMRYPGESHARLMVCGFVGAFVLGFLGTAFPRLAGNLRWRWWEFLALFGAWLGMVMAYGHGEIRCGDGWFGGWLLLLLAGMVLRWAWNGRDTPPPGFVLVFIGLASGIWGARYLTAGEIGSVEAWRMARLCVYQSWLLLPILGIGPELFGMHHASAAKNADFPQFEWVRSILRSRCLVEGFEFLPSGHDKPRELRRPHFP